MLNISENLICFGCRACEKSCNKKAISMREDKEGFLRPFISHSQCNNCGLYLKVCPAINGDTIKHNDGKIYAAQVKDKDLLFKSSSGGIFSAIANYTFENKGVVFGPTFDDKMNLAHIAIESTEELVKLRGSKYIQSDTADSYEKVKNYLINNRLVYFTGTPCQIAGLRMFLKKDYKNLITSDLICHGTPSQKIFKRFVKQMEQEKQCKIVNYFFRDKRKGWGCNSYAKFIRFGLFKGEIKYDINMEAYFNAFIKGHINRIDCYQCKFCTPQRVGDITLADYWSIDNVHPDFPEDIKKGISLISVNSEKGEKVWNIISPNITYVLSSKENVLKTCNWNFHSATILPPERTDSYERAFKDFKKFRRNYVKNGLFIYNLKSIYKKIFR